MGKGKDNDNILLIVALLAVLVSLLAAGFTYYSIADLTSKISGYATSIGQANLTVESSANINFTTDFISWGSGRVTEGQSSAQLTTLETNNVTNGNWTLVQQGGLRIENIGNVNVTLNLAAAKTAAQFIGGTSPGYQWNVTAVEANACLNGTGGTGGHANLTIWYNTNSTAPGTRFCEYFQYINDRDLIRIDLNLTVPYNSLTGALTDTLTATGTSI